MSTSTSTSNSTTGSPYQLSRTSSQTSFTTDHQDDIPGSLDTVRTTTSTTVAFPPVRKIVFVGAGYVGGPTAAVIAYHCPHIHITVVDKSAARIAQWKSKHLPIHEPGLRDIVREARDGTAGPQARPPNLFFSTACDAHVAEADVIFLAVNTPTKTEGIGAGAATDMAMFESAARAIALVAKSGAVIVEKSTVPCRTAEMVREILDFHRPGDDFEILSNPEFLAEGTAVRDLLEPSRILIGSSGTPRGEVAARRLAAVYAHWVPAAAILTVDVWSSELAKLVANAMLAQRISSINTVSAICERTGADVDNVARAIGQDPRLGDKFLHSGLGFGGSCFKKDILSLSYLAESLDLPEVAHYWRQVVDINEWQCRRFVRGVLRTLNGSLRGKKVAVLGYAFKKDTADTRESQATEVVRMLLQENAGEIAIWDPQCDKLHIEQELTALLGSSTSSSPILQPQGPVSISSSPYDACATASAVLILTEWDQFRYPPTPTPTTTTTTNKFNNKPPPPNPKLTRPPQPHHADSAIDCTLRPLPSLPLHLLPEPTCPPACHACASDAQKREISDASLDWPAIAKIMRGERWVFDARGVCDQRELEKVGFLVRGIGRVGSRARGGWGR